MRLGWTDTSTAAKRLGLSPVTVIYLARTEQLRATRLGARWLISTADLERLARERSANPPRRVGVPREGRVADPEAVADPVAAA